MKLTRSISLCKNDILELLKNGKYIAKKGESWSGENTKESFKNEWDKGYEVILYLESSLTYFKKLTHDDVDDEDVTDDDINLYDEHRTTKEILLLIEDAEYELEYIEENGFDKWVKERHDQGHIELYLY